MEKIEPVSDGGTSQPVVDKTQWERFGAALANRKFWELLVRSLGWSFFTIVLATSICGFSNFLFGVEKHFGGIKLNVFGFGSLKTDQIFSIALALNSAIIVEYIYHLTLKDCVPVEDFIFVGVLGVAIFITVISDAVHRKHEVEKAETCERLLAQGKKDFFRYEDLRSRLPKMSTEKSFSKEDARYHLQLFDSSRAKWWTGIIVDTALLSPQRFMVDSLNPNSQECINEFKVPCRHYSKLALLMVLFISMFIRIRMGYSELNFSV